MYYVCLSLLLENTVRWNEDCVIQLSKADGL